MKHCAPLRKIAAIVAFAGVLALAPTGIASADPIPGNRASLAQTYTCNVTWIDNWEIGTGYYSRPDRPSGPGPYSWTWTQETHYGHTGSAVIEVQCLLKFWATYISSIYDPGPVDGQFGTRTSNAVVNAQKYCFWNEQQWDGQVGPITWPCLRRLGW